MLQMRIMLCFFLVAVVVVSAITVKPFNKHGSQLSLLNVDGQGHENAGKRLVRQFYGRRYGGYHGSRGYRGRTGYYG